MEQIIKSIRKHIRENKLSFLIGSGFSKNASQIYPDWKDIMTDMLDYLYEDKIQLSYKQCDKGIDYNKYKTDYLDQIVSELGYLKIASEYVKRKQYREAIDIYIESHVPFATKRGTKYLANSKELNLTLHRRLLSLNAQNIYTFNYDNLLELASGADKVKEIHTKRDKICKELSELHADVDKYNSLYRELSVNIDFKDVKTDDVNDPEQVDLTQMINQINSLLEDINKKYAISLNHHTSPNNDDVHKQNENLLKEKEDLLFLQQRSLENTLDQGYLPVTKSWEISLTEKTKNIFKLHGDLRGPKKDIYGFDGDNHKHYVITQEDYNTYHQKHEAFVNLMRISLLKGVFCAIGFGGDDPNFLAWISWVRDILEKGRADRGISDTKIYFIEVSDQKLSEERKQLFANHNIEYVRLCDIYGVRKPYELLEEFLSEIASDSALQSYKEVWNDLPWERKYGNTTTKDQVAFNQNDADSLVQLCNKNKLPSITDRASLKRDNILSDVSSIINSEYFNINSAKVIYAAIKGQLLPLDYLLSPIEINVFKGICASDEDMSNRIKILQIRNDILYDKTVKFNLYTDECKYEECLQSAFRLNFKKLKKQITSWNPTDKHWIVKKALLGSIFDKSRASSTRDLKTTLEPEDFSCSQEYIYAVECLGRLDFSFDESVNEKIKKIIANDSNNVRLYDKLDDFKRKLRKDPEKIIPYQNSNRIISQSKSSSDFELSIQLLQTFIELGMPMQQGRGVLFNNTGWYPAFRQLYDTFPFPCLYYSVQYGSDDNFLKRVAQDFTYANILTSILEHMLEYMLKALLMKETPLIIRESMYVMSPLFMQRVESKKWFDLFRKFYAKCDINKYGEDSRFDKNERDFIIKGIEMCANINFRLDVLRHCLHIQNLTHFHNSIIIAAKNKLKQLDADIINTINPLIERVDSMPEFYILFNLSDYFTDIQKQKWIKKLSEYDKYDTCQSVMIEASSEYANMSPEIQAKIKHSLVSCNRLWNSGRKVVDDDVSYGNSDNVDLRRIKNIHFSEDELHHLYISLKKSLLEIEAVAKKRYDVFWHNDRKLLLQMLRFLELQRLKLSYKDDFNTILDKVVLLHKTQCDNKSLHELLASPNGNYVDMGLQQLMFYVNIYGIEKYIYECILLSNIVISQSHEDLESCFDNFVYYIDKHQEYFSNSDIMRTAVSSILMIYEPYFKKESEVWDLRLRKSFAEELLILLNKIHSGWGGKSVFWDSYIRIFHTTF